MCTVRIKTPQGFALSMFKNREADQPYPRIAKSKERELKNQNTLHFHEYLGFTNQYLN
jgi:hypothetical protein